MTCATSSLNGLCEGTVPIPTQWFSHSQQRAVFTVQMRLLSSFNQPQTIGSVAVNPRPNMIFTNNVAFLPPSRPVSLSQLFNVPVYGHATYPIAAYSVKCQVGENLVMQRVSIDSDMWFTEVRPLDVSGSREVGVVGVLRNPESVLEALVSLPELLFSFEVRVSPSAVAGEVEAINCTTDYLSNILNEKIQPQGLITPTPSLFISSSTISPGRGEVRIARSIARGLFSFAEQSQVVNTAVLNKEALRVELVHLLAMSSGVLVNATDVQCTSTSLAFQLSAQCTQVILNGSEPEGTSGDIILSSYLNLSSSAVVRVWYPNSPVSIESSPPLLQPIQGWELRNDVGQCSQQYQTASLNVFAEFSYSTSTSPIFRVSVLPLLTSLIVSSNSTVVEVDENGLTLVAKSPGTSIISAGSFVMPTSVVVSSDPITVSSLDVTLFSGISINLPASPFPSLSVQSAAVNVDQSFDSISSPVFISLLLLMEDGSTMLLDQENAGILTITSLSENTVEVSDGNISLLRSGSGDLVQVTLSSPCTGLALISGNGSAQVNVPDPLRLQTEQSAARVTYPGNTAEMGGIPTSLSLRVLTIFPDSLTRDSTGDAQISYSILQGTGLVDLTVSPMSVLIVPSDPNRSAFGEVVILISHRSFPITNRISFTVVTYIGVRMFALPYPPYPGSNLVDKSTLFEIQNTGQYQQASLELQAILSDNSSISVTRSPLAFYRSTSPSVMIRGNVVQVSQVGMFEIQGQLGPNSTSLNLIVSSTSVSVTALQNFSLQVMNSTLSGTVGTRVPLNLDVIFSDMTLFPGFVPNATNLFHRVVSLTVDTPSVVSINPLTGFVTLQGNHHSLVTITASTIGSTQVQSQVSFGCNLQPAVGDVDLGASEGIPVPPVVSGNNFSVPLVVNAGQQPLGAVSLTIAYSLELLSVVAVDRNPTWIGDFNYANTRVLTITANSANGSVGLVHLGTIQFRATSSGVGSIGGVVTLLRDTSGTPIGNGRARQFIAGQVRVDVVSTRSRRSLRAADLSHLRVRRNTECLSPIPCDVCPDPRETGDVNGDCIFNSTDVQFLLRYHAERLFDFRLDSGSSLYNSLISVQRQQLDSDLNTALDPQDAYFLHQVQTGLLYFLGNISLQPIQESSSCQLAINATLLQQGDLAPDSSLTTVFFDIALPFDPTFTTQQLFDESLVRIGSVVSTAAKGLTLPGGILQANQLEPGVYGIVMETNLTMSSIGVSAIQSSSPNAQNTNHARTKAMFGSPDPPYTYPNSLMVRLPSFSESVTVQASQGYSPFTFLNNSMTTLACMTPPPPPLIAQPLVQAAISENASIGMEVVTISAQSQSDRPVRYSIALGNTGNVFSIGASDGTVTVALPLDFESVTFYTLRILATDPASGFTSSAVAEITVTDFNDNVPMFAVFELDISLAANTPVGAVIAVVRALDADDGTNAMIVYSTAANDNFMVDLNTGIVTLQQQLDFNVQNMHLLTITATDLGDPPLSSSITLNITVLPPDPTTLQFANPVYSVNVTENSPDNLPLLELRATPVNQSSEATITIGYTLESPRRSPFAVNVSTGLLTVNGSIDRELTSSYELRVSATVISSSRAIPAVAVVLVTVQDLNDNSPVFVEEEYSASTEEGMSTGSLQIRLRALDPDLGLNGTIRYSLNETSDLLSIDPSTGILTNSQPLDYEVTRAITVSVVAMDMGTPSLSSMINVSVTVIDINDNPPSLVVVPDVITINESTEVGSMLAVAMVDGIDSPSVNGDITLSLASREIGNPFEINSTTGEITTSAFLDFERVQEYNLTVTARESGPPSMESRQNFVVFILDVNDNAPVFDVSVYNVTVNESIGVPALILQLTASDADSGSNTDLFFTIISTAPPSNQFSLSPDGRLEIVQSLDFEVTQVYSISVMVENAVPGAEPGLATVNVQVIDVNESPPEFSQDVYTVSVMEEAEGAHVVQVRVNDSDLNDRVSLSTDNTNFRIGADGVVVTATALDRERAEQYNFTVLAEDDGVPVMSARALVVVDVMDINDNSPVFDPFQNISILESILIGSTVQTFSASDVDEGANGTIGFFSLVSTSADFSLTSDGRLSVERALSASSMSFYLIPVQVQDLGTPPLTSTATIAITVESSPIPVFDQTTYFVSVLENIPSAFLVQVTATSQNSETGSVRYHLNTEDLSHLFAVDESSGNVMLTAPLNREERDTYSIEVGALTVFNFTNFTAFTQVNISVLDVNDNAPQFLVSSQSVSINETISPNTDIISFQAADIDLGNNSIIQYSIVAGNEDLQLVIDQNGLIRTTTSLLAQVGWYNITIQAANPVEFGSLSSTAELLLEIQPVNDFQPMFVMDMYTVNISEDARVNEIVISVPAVDPDEGTAGEISYNITSGNEAGVFTIDPNTGNISLARTLDFESQTQYNITVLATDAGTPPQSSRVPVYIQVTDINDNQPVFTQQLYTGSVDENLPAGQSILRVQVTDADSPPNSAITYDIMPSDISSMFTISLSGVLENSLPLDRETRTSALVFIRAVNSDSRMTFTATTMAQIIINDVNDNAPIFTQQEYSSVVQAPVPVNATILRVQANDADSLQNNARVQYSLLDRNSSFYIDPVSGLIQVASEILREGNFTLTVVASDGGIPVLSNQSIVRVTILSPDDLTAGRERDIVFTSEEGINLLSSPVEVSADSYQQMFGFAVGRDIRQSRTITASLSSLSASISVSPRGMAAESVKAVLLSNEVWHDEPEVKLVVQARDGTHNVHVVANILAQLTHPRVGMVSGSCTTRSSDGTCIITITVPSVWFESRANATVQFGLTSIALQSLGRNVEIQQRPLFNSALNIYVFMEMPVRNLFVNDAFSIPVRGRTGSTGVGSYTLTVQGSNSVDIASLTFDSTLWRAQVQRVGGNVTITAVRSDQNTIPPAGEILLFTIQARVLPSSPVNALITSAVTAVVVELSDFNRMRLLPPPGMMPGQSLALSRDGIMGSGTIYVTNDNAVGLLPYVNRADLINTALLNEVIVSEPVIVLSILMSGSMTTLSGSGLSCTSGNSSIVSVVSDCSSISLTSSQTTSSISTLISVSHDGQLASFPVEVWVPQMPVRLAVADGILNNLAGVPDLRANCTAMKQFTNVRAFARFINSDQSVQDVDVTHLVSMRLSSSDNNVAVVNGSTVFGSGVGTATIRGRSLVNGVMFSEVEITVADTPVEILGLDVRVITQIQASGPQQVTRLAINNLLVSVQQMFDFEGVQGTAIAAAVFSDGTRVLLDDSQVSFSSLQSNVVEVSGTTVRALASGGGDIIQAVWNPPSECGTNPIATGLATVSVNIPLPTSISVSLSSPLLAAPGSTANLIGVSTSSTLRVIARYADERAQDLTLDNRTIYNTPNNVDLTIDGGGVTLTTNANATLVGDYSISISFTQFQGVMQAANFTIVNVADISLIANPYPFFPGSSSMSVRALAPIANISQRQQVVIRANAVLSNGNTIDISTNAGLEFRLETRRTSLRNSAMITRSAMLNILSFREASPFGTLTVRAVFREVGTNNPLILNIITAAVQIREIRISPFPDNTFRGIIDATQHQVIVSLTFDDRTQLVNLDLSRDTMYSGLVRFSAFPSSSLTINSETALATLRGNSQLSPAQIFVNSRTLNISQSLSVACNLDPDVGDVDLGSSTGIPVPMSSVSDRISMTVRVNSGTSILDSIDLDITFDPSIIRAISAVQGSDWPSTGLFAFRTDDPIHLISFGGTLVGSTPVRGTSLHLATITFEAVGAGVTNISGLVRTLAEQRPNGSASIGVVPRAFTAGAIQTIITGSRRRRSADLHDFAVPHVRSRRQSAVCPSPPCASCNPQGRETGDVDGNCIFDVRDASFLQLHYLTTVATGVAPTLPEDRSMFLDSDLDGRVDSNDVVFMLRVNFRLLRFAFRPQFVPVEQSGDSCQFSVNITLVERGDIPANNVSTALIFDIANEDSSFQAMFDATNFTVGRVLPESKGSNFYGGLVEGVYLGNGVYSITAESALGPAPFGISPIQVTFDGEGQTSSLRTATLFFSRGVPRYTGMLNASISLRGETITLSSQLGYSPLLLANSSLTSAECLLLQSPFMFENRVYITNVSEAANIGDVVIQVLATSNRPSVSINYTITNTGSLPFNISSNTGDITVTNELDFESTSSFSLMVAASELLLSGEVFTATAQVLISVTNENDLPPFISPLPTTSVLASQQIREDVAQVVANDPDNLDALSYTITASSVPGLFSIDVASGVVRIERSLLPNSNSLVVLNITVSDSAFSTLSSVNLDVYLPSFSERVYSTNISEATAPGNLLVQLRLVNTRNEVFIFMSQDDRFGVNQTGEVVLNTELDYEEQVIYSTTILANSSNIEVSAQLLIYLRDENDNAPVFTESAYNISISANTPVGSPILMLQATDRDSPGPNSDIDFSISPDVNSNLFRISQLSGVVELAETVFNGPNIVILNVIATDNGSPTMTGSVTVIIQINTTDIPGFPIPPTVRAFGDALRISGPVRIMSSNNSRGALFQQTFTKLSSSLSGQLLATFEGSSIRSSSSFTTTLQQAPSATAHLLNPTTTVYQESRSVRLSFQVRDVNHLTRVTGTTLQGQAVLAGSSERVTSSPCNPDSVFGICVVTVTLPDSWFNVSSNVIIEPTLNGGTSGIESNIPLLSLQPSPSLVSAITNDILVELPSRDIVSGRSFTLEVYGYSTFTISGFSLVFQTQDLLTITTVMIDMSQWSMQSANGSNSFGISAISSVPTGGGAPNNGRRIPLFTLQVLTTSGLSSAMSTTITARIQSLSNPVEGSTILTSTGSTSGPAQFLSRSGQGTTGTVHIVPNNIIAVYPYVRQSELLNTAVLSAAVVTVPVQLLVGYSSGEVLVYTGGGVTCSSDTPGAINPDPSCTSLQLVGNETAGSDLVQVSFDIGSVSGRLPLRVYYPQIPLSYRTTDRVLNLIQYSESSDCRAYQQAILSIFTDFTASPQQRLLEISVTDLISPLLFSGDPSVLALVGSRVLGVSPGSTVVCSTGLTQSLGCIDITVSSEPVSVIALVGSVLIDVTITTSSGIAANSTSVADIQAREEFQFEQERGSLVVAVQFSDGALSAVNGSEVALLPSNSSLYSINDNTIVSRGSGETIGSFVWQPLGGQCSVTITDFFLFSSSLPTPMAIQTSLPPSPVVHLLTTPLDPATSIGVSSSLSITVTLVFPGGRLLDVTTDSRLTYVFSNDTLSIAGGVINASEGAIGSSQLTIQYKSSDVVLTANIDILVVVSTALSIRANPFPTYPGSADVSVTTLQPIEDTGMWQRASLQVQLSLSNGTAVDVSGLSETSLQAVVLVPPVVPQILDGSVLSVTGGVGIIQIRGTFVTQMSDLVITVDMDPVRVTGVNVVPLPSNTLKGITRLSTQQLNVDLTLSDGTRLLSYPANPAFSSNPLPGIVRYNASSTTFSVDSGGLLLPITNSHIPVSVDITAGSNSVPSSYSFVVNLDPGVGDVDIGMATGSPIPNSRAGSSQVLPIVVNTGGRNLGSIDIVINYDVTVISPTEVTLGPGFVSGVHEASLNDPPGEIRFGGALSSDISGSRLHLFNLRFSLIAGLSSPGESFLRGSVVTFAERNLVGTPIGLATPRPIVAGNITFSYTVAGNSKRSIPESIPPSPSSYSHSRQRRQMSCPSPPCPCSGLSLGDADGNCIFDVRDVSFTLLYISESLLTSSQSTNNFLSQVTQAQLRQLDPNQDSIIDTSDAFFLLRALFRLVYFLENVSVTPIQDPLSRCLFTVQVQLRTSQGTPLGQVEVFIDFGFVDSSSNIDFADSGFLAGQLLTTDKGESLNGGIVKAQESADGLFIVQLNSSFVSSSVGISVITATFDAHNSTSSSRSVQFFGRPPLLYPFPLSLNLPTRNTQILVAASSGYSPFTLTSNTIATSQCSDFPLLEPELNVTSVSAFQALLGWNLLNMRRGLNLTSSLTLLVINCTVDQNQITLNSTCVGPTSVAVDSSTSHTLQTRPFTAYYLQVQASTSSTDVTGIVSPEAPPTGVNLPTYSLRSDRTIFTWTLPTSPNGIITHYTLYVNSEAIFNGSGLSFLYTQAITEEANLTLEAHNSAGIGTSGVGIISVATSTDSTGVIGISLALADIIIICVVVTAFVIIMLLLLMLCCMIRRRWTQKTKKRPAFLSSNFTAENIGVVCDHYNYAKFYMRSIN